MSGVPGAFVLVSGGHAGVLAEPPDESATESTWRRSLRATTPCWIGRARWRRCSTGSPVMSGCPGLTPSTVDRARCPAVGCSIGGSEGRPMGVWGPGNFDGDLPRDFLADMVGRWELLVGALLAGALPEEAAAFRFDLRLDTWEACLMPTVEILRAVAERLGPDYLPAPETVERWRSQYLSLFDREASSWGAGPNHEAERRAV